MSAVRREGPCLRLHPLIPGLPLSSVTQNLTKKTGGLAGLRVAIIGSVEPWYEAICLAYGAAACVSVDYNPVHYAHPRLVIRVCMWCGSFCEEWKHARTHTHMRARAHTHTHTVMRVYVVAW